MYRLVESGGTSVPSVYSALVHTFPVVVDTTLPVALYSLVLPATTAEPVFTQLSPYRRSWLPPCQPMNQLMLLDETRRPFCAPVMEPTANTV